MNTVKKTGIVVGFYLAICVASLATSGLAWFITRDQASVKVTSIGIADKNGRLIIELEEEETEMASAQVTDVSQTEYTISDPLFGESGGGREIQYVDVYGSPSGLAFTPKRASGALLLRVPRNDESGTQEYYFDGIDSDNDGNEDGVLFNRALPSGASELEIHYSYDAIGAYSSTKSMNINAGHPDYAPVGTEDSLTITPEAISDVSSDGETFYKNNMSPDGTSISSVVELTGREKVYGGASIGSYIQFTFWVINELQTSKPVDIAISQNGNDELLSVDSNNENADEHYRMAIYDTTDPANPEQVFFYEQKNWESSDHYVNSATLSNGANTFASIGEDEIVDGSEFQVVKSQVEAGEIPLPGNQLLYSGLRGGEHCSLTVRLWCEGTLCDNDDIGKICNATFNIVGYDHY